jgi:hypothetical protein
VTWQRHHHAAFVQLRERALLLAASAGELVEVLRDPLGQAPKLTRVQRALGQREGRPGDHVEEVVPVLGARGEHRTLGDLRVVELRARAQPTAPTRTLVGFAAQRGHLPELGERGPASVHHQALDDGRVAAKTGACRTTCITA